MIRLDRREGLHIEPTVKSRGLDITEFGDIVSIQIARK